MFVVVDVVVVVGCLCAWLLVVLVFGCVVVVSVTCVVFVLTCSCMGSDVCVVCWILFLFCLVFCEQLFLASYSWSLVIRLSFCG